MSFKNCASERRGNVETSLRVTNAILFIVDPANHGFHVPEYVPERPTAANSTCVSVKTRAEVDGVVTLRLVALTSAPEAEAGITVYTGQIATPSRTVAVVTSSSDRVLETEVEENTTDISVAVDDVHAPARITVRVGRLILGTESCS